MGHEAEPGQSEAADDPAEPPAWEAAVAEGRRATPTGPAPPRRPRGSRRAALTDRRLAELAASRLIRPLDVTDTTVRGLVARVSPTGTIAFFFRHRDHAGQRRVRLDAACVAEAREKAVAARAAVAIGRDPRATAVAFAKPLAKTVAEAVPGYLAALAERGRSPSHRANVEAMFENHVLRVIGRVRLVDLTLGHLADLHDRLRKKTSPKAKGRGGRVTTMPNRVHVQVMALLRWAKKQGWLPGDLPSVERPIAEEPSARREREGTKVILRLPELARVWLAVEDEPPRVRALVRLLLLLPMRREEITGLVWSEVKQPPEDAGAVPSDPTRFDGPCLDIQAWRMKGKRPQIMPLPPMALERFAFWVERLVRGCVGHGFGG
jgi:integrase